MTVRLPRSLYVFVSSGLPPTTARRVGKVELENRWGCWRREPFTRRSPLLGSVCAKT
jgi:hypothetical protein